jgi:uncharacterized ferritin-like protein (DUF455 family)
MKSFLAECLKPVERACQEFPWRDKESYAQFLAQVYYYVCHSTRLLGFAAARFTTVEEKFHRRFMEHAAEEKGHQFLAEKDLKALGYSLAAFPEHPATSLFYESQYYKIEFQDPMALLGYILVLEGISVKKGAYINQVVQKAFGKQASTFMHVHSSDDPDHLEKAFALIEGMDEKRKEIIRQNIRQSAFGFINILLSCQTGASVHVASTKAAA